MLWLAGRAVAILPEIFLAGIFARQMASAHTYLEHKVTSGVGGRGGGGGGGGGEAPKLLSFLDAGREFLSDVGNTGDAFSSSSSSLFSSSSSSSSATWGTWGRALVAGDGGNGGNGGNGGDRGVSSGILGLPWWRVAHAFFQGTTTNIYIIFSVAKYLH